VPTLTPEQQDDAVRLVENGYSTAAVAKLMGVGRRHIQNLVSDARAVDDAEVVAAREAYRTLAAQRGARVPMTAGEKTELLDSIFGTDAERSANADQLFGFDPLA
jgi:predicted transcriptional regulator